MSKRPKSELNPIKQPPVHTSAKNQPKNTTKSQDNSILNIVVGSLNVKRWKELKNAFSCKTNEKFITQLLDIAQQYLQGHPSKPNVKAKAKPQSPKQIATNNNVETKLEPEPEEIKRKPTLPSKSKPTVKTEPAIKKRQNEYDVRKAPELEIQTTIENIKIEKVEKPSDDKVCHNCYTNHAEDDCPINYPHCIIHDSTINKTNLEDDAQSFSYLSLPRALYLDKGWSGVFAKTNLNPFTEFGPLIGTPIKEVDISEDSSMRDIWEIVNHDGNVYLNTENSEVANWLRFMRPAASREDRNVTVTCKEGKLYFISIREIRKDEELVYWQDSCFLSNKKKLEKTSCGGCNMTFSHPLYYRTHCSVFHDVRYSLTIRKYHCKVCGAAVLGKENIMKHAAELHNGQGAYQCQFCKKFFLRLNYLEMHRTYGCSANPHRSRPLCDFCGKKFCQPQKLKVHIKRMHSDIADVIKEFQCKSCLKILGSRAALQRHLKEVHQKQLDGACSCTRCGKHFQNKSNLKIHMLTHSGIKPFKCIVGSCNAAFTTKQCLQFHYKKVHSFMEETMPKIERSIDYTFQAYSGFEDELEKNNEMDSDMEDASLDSKSIDDPPASQSPLEVTDEPPPSPPPQLNPASPIDYQPLPSPTIKIASKGSKKWIADEPLKLLKSPELYRINKDDLSNLNLPEPEIYDRNKIDFATRQDASNASLLVEAALDSVCSEPNIDIDVSSTPNCTTDSLVNNLYTLTQPDALPEVTYSDNLMSPSVNDHISVTDELNDELRHSHSIGMDYSNFHQEDFSPANSPNMHQRSNFVRNYINNLSPQNYKSPSPPRYDFGHAHESDDSNNGMSAQNLSLNNSKNEIQLDLSIYKSYKLDYQQRRLKFDGELSPGLPRKLLGVDSLVNSSVMDGIEGVEVDVEKEADRSKYPDDLSSEIRNKFELDLDLRLKNYELDRTYVENEVDFRGKSYDLNLESDFRTTDRNFEPLLLNNGSEIQGLDMSARSFHNYPINRYHHLYPEVDRINYSPPPPPPPYADILRVVSLDLTPPGRHSVDLSLRPHPFANSRLLSEHPLHQTNSHRLPMLGSDLSTGRLLTDHTTNRILVNDQSSHLIEDSRILTESRLLPSTPSGSVSPVPTFSGYSVSQSPYHPTPLAARSHVTSPTSTPYHHYSSYY